MFDIRTQTKTYVENDVRVAVVKLAVEIFRPVTHLEFLRDYIDTCILINYINKL